MILEYIFDPASVAKTLELYPSLRQRLPNPADEGRETINFKARKTDRQIYRILLNQHYAHLETLEFCLTSGYEQPKLLKTRVRQDYGSALAELFMAEFFIRHGFKTQGLEQGKGSTSVPDMLVELGTVSLSVEVYSPRDWGGMDDFLDELRLGVLHLDVPWDFRFEIKTGVLKEFDGEEKSLRFNPWQFSEAFENPEQRLVKIAPILFDIQTSLTGSTEDQTIRRMDESHNIFTEIRIEKIHKSQGHLPCRHGGGLDPTLSGYAPEAMFDQLIKRRILKKIRKGQAQSLQGKHIQALFVDLSRLGYWSAFEHPSYRQDFQQRVESHFDPAIIDVDWVVFFLPTAKAGGSIWFPLVFRKANVPHDLDSLFGCAESAPI